MADPKGFGITKTAGLPVGGSAVVFASPPGPLSKKRGGGEAPGICGFLV